MSVIVYTAGPYRAGHGRTIEENIEIARTYSEILWGSGVYAFSPHMNTALFDGIADDEVFLLGDIEILKRCDAVLLLPNWEQSSGARKERDIAIELGLKVFDDVYKCVEWARQATP